MAFDIFVVVAYIGKLLLGIVIAVLIALIYFKIRERRAYTYVAEVYERDNLGNLVPHLDRFAIMIDRRSNKEMGRLKGTKDWVGLDNFNYEIVRKGKKLIRRVRLLKVGEGNYIFLKPVVQNPKLELQVTREDVDWAINAYTKWAKALEVRNRMREIATFSALVLLLVGIIVLGVLLLKQFPQTADKIVKSWQYAAEYSKNALETAKVLKGVVS